MRSGQAWSVWAARQPSIPQLVSAHTTIWVDGHDDLSLLSRSRRVDISGVAYRSVGLAQPSSAFWWFGHQGKLSSPTHDLCTVHAHTRRRRDAQLDAAAADLDDRNRRLGLRKHDRLARPSTEYEHRELLSKKEANKDRSCRNTKPSVEQTQCRPRRGADGPDKIGEIA
jgi:hypothetical protein